MSWVAFCAATLQVGIAPPEELRELVKAELERYRRVVAAAGLRAE